MDPNEGVIDAEADVDQRIRHPTNGRSDSHTAEHAALLAGGGVHRPHTETDEETPLLFPGVHKGATKSRHGSEESDGIEEESWPGQHDFDGLPWWKTPSVCNF